MKQAILLGLCATFLISNASDYPLHNAICSNNKQRTSQLLSPFLEQDKNAQNLDLNEQDEQGMTPLHYACKMNLHRAVTMLCQIPQVRIDIPDNQGKTPLHYIGSELTLDYLLFKFCADQKDKEKQKEFINTQDNDGNTPLHCAKTKDIAKFLYQRNADITLTNNSGKEAIELHEATHPEIYEFLKAEKRFLEMKARKEQEEEKARLERKRMIKYEIKQHIEQFTTRKLGQLVYLHRKFNLEETTFPEYSHEELLEILSDIPSKQKVKDLLGLREWIKEQRWNQAYQANDTDQANDTENPCKRAHIQQTSKKKIAKEDDDDE